MNVLYHIELRSEIFYIDASLRLFLLVLLFILLRVEKCGYFCEIFLDIYLWFYLRIFVNIEVALSTYQLHVLVPTFIVNADPIGSLFWTVVAVGWFELSHLFFHEWLNISVFDLLHMIFSCFFLRFILPIVVVILTQSLVSVELEICSFFTSPG